MNLVSEPETVWPVRTLW